MELSEHLHEESLKGIEVDMNVEFHLYPGFNYVIERLVPNCRN